MKRPIEIIRPQRRSGQLSPDFHGKNGPEPLADIVGRFLGERSAELEKNAMIMDAWDKIVPENLRACCRVDGVRNGILAIEAAAGPCLYQLKTMSDEILHRFRQLCPSAKIQKICLHPLSLSPKDTASL